MIKPYELSNEELAELINKTEIWDDDQLYELCRRAKLLWEFNGAYSENFEVVIKRAADILGVDIGL